MSNVLQASIFLLDCSKVINYCLCLSQAAKCHLISSIYHSLQSPAQGRVASSSAELTTAVKSCAQDMSACHWVWVRRLFSFQKLLALSSAFTTTERWHKSVLDGDPPSYYVRSYCKPRPQCHCKVGWTLCPKEEFGTRLKGESGGWGGHS